MKVLITTLLRRTDTTVFQYPRATESILNIRWQNGAQIDHFMPSGGDENCINSITRKYEDARRIALDRNYDALLTVESDMVVPPDALERLAAVETDVAYGLYAMRTGAHHWNIATHVDRFEIVPMSANPLDAKERWGMIVECDGVGLGCTLIRRHVLEKVAFRFYKGAHTDHLFAVDVKTAGFTQAADTSVTCGHIVGTQVVYPTNTGCLWRMQP